MARPQPPEEIKHLAHLSVKEWHERGPSREEAEALCNYLAALHRYDYKQLLAAAEDETDGSDFKRLKVNDAQASLQHLPPDEPPGSSWLASITDADVGEAGASSPTPLTAPGARGRPRVPDQ